MDSPKATTKSESSTLPESKNESAQTLRFDVEQIRASGPRPGLVLKGRYRLDSEIGRGAMGVVFRATDLELLRIVAVKMLAERISGGNTRKQEQEAEAGTKEEKQREIGEEGKGAGVKEGRAKPEVLPESPVRSHRSFPTTGVRGFCVKRARRQR